VPSHADDDGITFGSQQVNLCPNLSTTRAPIGISEYTLAKALSDEYKGSLPTVEELEIELGAERDED
jgi:hypothetical protein